MPKLGGIYVSVRARTDKYKRDLANAKTLTKKAVIVMQHAIDSISWKQVGVAALAFGAIVAKVAFDGLKAMEKMKLSTASMASTITSFAKGADKDLSGTYLQALGYSEQLVLKMEELNAQTVATGENLTAMVETLAQGGVLLDINNQKQIDGFLALANALALVTQGQNADIQFRQEIRGLINGEVRATNALARILSQRVGGSLKEHVKLWKEQGTLIESAGALLAGFQEGAKDLANTWLAVGTTIRTMYDRTMRGLMAPVYEDIIRLGKQITIEVLDQNSALNKNATILRTLVFKGWQDIKNTVEVTVDLVTAFEGPLLIVGKLLSLIIDGWGQIFAILPAITERIKLITQAVFESVKMVGNWGKAMINTLRLNFKEAANAWEGAKANWIESGEKTAEAFSGGFINELDERLANYNKDLTVEAKTPVLPPELKPPAIPEIDKEKELKKLQEAGREKYAMEIALAELIEDDTWLIRQKGFDDAVKQHQETEMKITQIIFDIRKDFNEKYNELGKTRFDLEREQLERQVEIYREAGIEKNRIDEMVSKKSAEIATAEQSAKLEIYRQNAAQISDTFLMIAQAGGKSSKEAFIAFKAFAIAEAIISANLAAAKVLGQVGIFGIPLSAFVWGSAMANVAQIVATQPPSFDSGGISSAGGVYQTGNIQEAHVPIPSGKIPVQISGGGGGGQQTVQIILNNPVFQDLATQRQTMAQIASVVAAKVAPGAVIENYNNDLGIRRMIRGGR